MSESIQRSNNDDWQLIQAGDTEQVYFAAPLFSEAEKRFNLETTQLLEQKLGLTVFLPQRDGYESAKLGALSESEQTDLIFTKDRERVLGAHVILAVLDGARTDEGVAAEILMAYMHKHLGRNSQHRLLVGLKTDVRPASGNHNVNPMIAKPLEYVATDPADMIAYLGQRLLQEPWYTQRHPSNNSK